MRWNRISLLAVILLLLLLFFPVVEAANSAPTITKGTVTPRRGRPEIEYLFTATYSDSDNDKPSSMTVFIEKVEYDMEEVDPADTNYTDGKEYTFKKTLDEGSYSVYYHADDGIGNTTNSNSFTLSVTWDVGHYDLIHFFDSNMLPGIKLVIGVIVTLLVILVLILVVVVFQMRKITKRLEGPEEKG